MRTVCITLSSSHANNQGGNKDPAVARSRMEGLDADFFIGIHAKKLGIETTLTYEVDHPGTEFRAGATVVGCWLSHRTLWAALSLLPDEEVLVVEDDAKFPDGWRERLTAALRDVPPDWDMLWIGSCCTEDKPKTHIAGDVWDVRYPMCTHGYVVRKKALQTLIETQDDARLYAPIDISMVFHSFPKLHVYTVLPRILDQWDTVLAP